MGSRLHGVLLGRHLPVAAGSAQRVLLRRLGRDRRPDQRPPGRGRGRHRTPRVVGQCSQYTRGAVNMVINSPAPAAGPCTAAPAAFGPVFTQAGVTDDVVVATDAGRHTTDGCTAITNGAAVSGNFAYVDRGTCTFQVKVNNAAAAGATGIVVGDSVARPCADLDVGSRPTSTASWSTLRGRRAHQERRDGQRDHHRRGHRARGRLVPLAHRRGQLRLRRCDPRHVDADVLRRPGQGHRRGVPLLHRRRWRGAQQLRRAEPRVRPAWSTAARSTAPP